MEPSEAREALQDVMYEELSPNYEISSLSYLEAVDAILSRPDLLRDALGMTEETEYAVRTDDGPNHHHMSHPFYRREHAQRYRGCYSPKGYEASTVVASKVWRGEWRKTDG